MSGKYFALEREAAGSIEGIIQSKQRAMRNPSEPFQGLRGCRHANHTQSSEALAFTQHQVKVMAGPFPGRKPAALGIKSFTEAEHTDVLLSSLLSPRFPPPGQAPGCTRFQINLDAGLAFSLGTDIQLNPTFQNDLCMCLTASPVLQITPEIEKRS